MFGKLGVSTTYPPSNRVSRGWHLGVFLVSKIDNLNWREDWGGLGTRLHSLSVDITYCYLTGTLIGKISNCRTEGGNISPYSPDFAQVRSQTELINIHELSPTPIALLEKLTGCSHCSDEEAVREPSVYDWLAR